MNSQQQNLIMVEGRELGGWEEYSRVPTFCMNRACTTCKNSCSIQPGTLVICCSSGNWISEMFILLNASGI